MDTIATTILFIILFLVISLLLNKFIKHLALRRHFSVVPGPKSYPLIGGVLEIIRINTDDLDEWIKEIAFSFKSGLFIFWIGTEPTIAIRKPHHMEAILPNSKLIQKGTSYKDLKPWLGNGLLTSDGDKWHNQRRMITPAFHFAILSEFADLMAEKADIMNDCIISTMKKNPSEPVNIFELAIRCTLDTFCETAMGINDNMQLQAENAYVKAVQTSSKLIAKRNVRPWLASDFIYFMTPDGKKFAEAVKCMHDFSLKVIEKKQQERIKRTDNAEQPPEEDHIGKKRKAFLDLLLDASENESSPLTTEELREQVDTFMFAGHDTTAAAISWILFSLGNDPDIQRKVHEEIDEVFSNKDELITQKNLTQLKYLDKVIKEGLRMYPSAPSIERCLTQDIILDGFKIPKGTNIILFIEYLHNDPDIWENPEKFDPERFLAEKAHGRHPYSYIPFSAGPRNCIGQKFALLELKIVLTTVLRKWSVKSELTHDKVKYVAQIILRPRNNILNLYFTPRN